jgi:hypothetical protein
MDVVVALVIDLRVVFKPCTMSSATNATPHRFRTYMVLTPGGSLRWGSVRTTMCRGDADGQSDGQESMTPKDELATGTL